MSAKPKVFVAGVGLSQSSSPGDASGIVSSTTKALLDAGITYDSVVRSICSRDLKEEAREVFDSFSDDGVPVTQVSQGSEIKSAFESIESRGDGCILAVAVDKSATISLVLTSEDFMMRWPYLKDSSILLGNSVDAGNAQSHDSLSSMCQKVWRLRGWTRSKSPAADVSTQGFRLSRADGQKVPKWKDVEYKQDGKHRLGYNPANETREASQEDFEAVRASGKQPRQAGKALFKNEGGDWEILKRQQRYLAKL